MGANCGNKKNCWKNLLQQFYNREGIKLQKFPNYFAEDVHENTHEQCLFMNFCKNIFEISLLINFYNWDLDNNENACGIIY